MRQRFIDWHGAKLLAETYCFCGKVLTAMGPDPRVPPMSRELAATNVRTVIRETFVSRLRTADFATIEFEVEEPPEAFIPDADESQDTHSSRLGVHRTTVCKACKTALLDGQHDLEDVQRLYDQDVQAMGTPTLATRKVTRVLG